MKRLTLLIVAALLCGAADSGAQARVEATGLTAKVKLEEVVSGHLAELNGKFKMRATGTLTVIPPRAQ